MGEFADAEPTHDDERTGREARKARLSFAVFAVFVSVSANAQTPPLTTSLPRLR